MKMTWHLCLTIAVVALTAQTALAQRGGFGFGGDPLSLSTQESVQKELSLSSEQTGKLTDLAEKRRESFQSQQGGDREARRARFQEMQKENNAALAEILKPEQLKRLKEISLQQQGAFALANPEVAEALGLSDDQKKQVDDIRSDTMEEMRSAGQGGREQAREKFNAIRKSAEDKFRAVLNAEQTAKWTALQGAPFEGEIRRGGPGGGGRQRRGQN